MNNFNLPAFKLFIWEHCNEYDQIMNYLGTTGGIMALAFIVDLIVWYKAGSIKEFVDDPGNEDGTAEEMANLKTLDIQATENEYLWAPPTSREIQQNF